jgi:hypothetical protein
LWCAGGKGFSAKHVGNAAGAGCLRFGECCGRGIFVDGDAVEKANGAAGDGGDAVAGNEDTGEVERIGGSYGDGGFAGARGGMGAGLAEGVGSFRQGILLAEGAGDEAAATDLSTGFEAAEDGQEVAPFGGVGFACEKFAEEDAIAAEEDAGVGVEGGVGLFGGRDGGCGARGILRSHP